MKAKKRSTSPMVEDVRPLAAELFKEFDKDADGSLSTSEVKGAFRALRLPYSPEAMRDFMKVMDKNSDSKISKEEFIDFATSRQEQLVKVFRAIDVSGDGAICADDIARAVSKLELNMTPGDIRALVKHADRNDTGDVDFEEFLGIVLLVGDLRVAKVFEHWLQHAALDSGEYRAPPDEEPGTATWVLLASGGVAGAVSRTATAPMDRLKTLLQASSTQSSSTPSVRAGLQSIYNEGGWKAFWRGNGANVVKIAPETACKFWAYETVKALIVSDPDNITMFERFASGASAGAIAQSMVYPMEITKTRMALAKQGDYNGIVDCMYRTFTREGIKGLYRGLGASLAGIVPYSGVDLTVYSLLKDVYAAKFPDEEPGVGTLLCCGAVSTTCGQLVAYPLQLIRTRLQAQGMKGRPVLYDNAFDCARKTVAQDGFRGLYRGILPNFAKSLPAISISYAVYESSKRWLTAL